jgi:hypothetical protein
MSPTEKAAREREDRKKATEEVVESRREKNKEFSAKVLADELEYRKHETEKHKSQRDKELAHIAHEHAIARQLVQKMLGYQRIAKYFEIFGLLHLWAGILLGMCQLVLKYSGPQKNSIEQTLGLAIVICFSGGVIYTGSGLYNYFAHTKERLKAKTEDPEVRSYIDIEFEKIIAEKINGTKK